MSRIGIVDSGVGGLTLLESLKKAYPNEDYVFIGDNARVPYGSRTNQELNLFFTQMISKLVEIGVDLVVVACNTLSTLDLDDYEKKYNMPFIGIIQPTAQLADQVSDSQEIAIIATPTTIASQYYEEFLKDLNPNNQVFSLSTPHLASLVETDVKRNEEGQELINRELEGLKGASFDTLILGCTHYPFIKEEIEKAIDHPVKIVDASLVIPQLLKAYLGQESPGQSNVQLYTSGDTEKFIRVAEHYIDLTGIEVKQIRFEE